MLLWHTWTDHVRVVVWKPTRNQLKKGGDFMVAEKEVLLVEAEVRTGQQLDRDGEDRVWASYLKESSGLRPFSCFERIGKISNFILLCSTCILFEVED